MIKWIITIISCFKLITCELVNLFYGFIKRTSLELDYVITCTVLHVIHTVIHVTFFVHVSNSGEFRCKKHWHTASDGFDAVVAGLWCSLAFLYRLMNFMNRWHEVMERKKRRGKHGNVNSHITLVRVDTVEQCFWCHPFDGETTLKGHRSVRTTAVLTQQDIQTPIEHQQACSLISYCPI